MHLCFHMLCEFIPNTITKYTNTIHLNGSFFWHFHSGNFLSFIPTFHACIDVLEVMYSDGNLLRSREIHGNVFKMKIWCLELN